MRVFIADDSAVVRERVAAMLSELSCGVEVIGQAGDGAAALEAIRTLKPDAVVLDIRMPRGSGIEVLEEIKRDRQVPVVMMLTNYPYPQYRKRCLEAGADYFLDKSMEFEKVRDIVTDLASHHPQIHRPAAPPTGR